MEKVSFSNSTGTFRTKKKIKLSLKIAHLINNSEPDLDPALKPKLKVKSVSDL
jgi:hypothetical protein